MTRIRGNDRGQITTALVIVGTVMVVALAVVVTKLGQATDQKSQVQSAADAAALAGAQQIRSDAPGLILAALLPGGDKAPFNCGMGRAAASDFANRAGARVVQYCYIAGSDTIQVLVYSETNSVSGAPAKAKAEARLGLALGDCVVPTPTPTPTPTPNIDATVRCGDLLIPIDFDGASGGVRIRLSDSEIRGLFTPALKS